MLEIEHILRTTGLSDAQQSRISPAATAFGKSVDVLFNEVDQERIGQALALMLELHRDQKPRPDSAPYIEHPLAVAAGVLDAMSKKDPEMVIAALLHDTVEDQGEKLAKKATAQEHNTHKDEQALALAVIERLTRSERVRELVGGLTNPDFKKQLADRGIEEGHDETSQERYIREKNALYAKHVSQAIQDPDVGLIKLFDFATNALGLDGVPNPVARQKYARKYGTVIESITERVRDNKRPLNMLPEKREAMLARLKLASLMLGSNG